LRRSGNKFVATDNGCYGCHVVLIGHWPWTMRL
jgi:hypothetical protein